MDNYKIDLNSLSEETDLKYTKKIEIIKCIIHFVDRVYEWLLPKLKNKIRKSYFFKACEYQNDSLTYYHSKLNEFFIEKIFFQSYQNKTNEKTRIFKDISNKIISFFEDYKKITPVFKQEFIDSLHELLNLKNNINEVTTEHLKGLIASLYCDGETKISQIILKLKMELERLNTFHVKQSCDVYVSNRVKIIDISSVLKSLISRFNRLQELNYDLSCFEIYKKQWTSQYSDLYSLNDILMENTLIKNIFAPEFYEIFKSVCSIVVFSIKSGSTNYNKEYFNISQLDLIQHMDIFDFLVEYVGIQLYHKLDNISIGQNYGKRQTDIGKTLKKVKIYDKNFSHIEDVRKSKQLKSANCIFYPKTSFLYFEK